MKRYCLDREPNCTCLMCGDPEGSWVTYDEAKALQKELDELKASIPHLISSAIYEALDKFGSTNGYHAIDLVDHMEDFANKLLEGKE